MFSPGHAEEQLPSPGAADEVDRQTTTTGSNYIVIHGGGTSTTSPTGTLDSLSNNHLQDSNLSNYLEPLPSSGPPALHNQRHSSIGSIGPLSSATATTPDSPHSISTENHNPTYQELSLARSGGDSSSPATRHSHSLVKLRSLMSTDQQSPPTCGSAESLDEANNNNSNNINNNNNTPTYMNITPGDPGVVVNRFSQRSSIFSNFADRCYENLDPSQTSNGLKSARFSKPDIFAKVDLPLSGGPGDSGPRTSEPCTPTGKTMNYIVLDLDSQNSVQTQQNHMTPSPTTATLQTPESPSKRQTAAAGYVTIDFNKTVALSSIIPGPRN